MFPQTVKAEEALALGLAHRVLPGTELMDEARAFARQLAEGPTVAYGAIKAAVAFGAGHTLVETLAKEEELQTLAGDSADHMIAVEAFLAKEPPRFTGR
jgi:2-(1,2-epoxy-1,2-dihydrophenyl)acetyl-CoA isomerase